MSQITDDDIAADILGALGNTTRLQVFRLLVRAGHDGLNIGRIQEQTGVAPSTLAHHLQTLAHSGLIKQDKVGREVICKADFKITDSIIAYLTDECCTGVP